MRSFNFSGKSTICPEFSFLHGTGTPDIFDIALMNNDNVNHVPIFRPRMHPIVLYLSASMKMYW